MERRVGKEMECGGKRRGGVDCGRGRSMVVKGDMCGWGGSAEGNNFKYALKGFCIFGHQKRTNVVQLLGGGGGLVLGR